MIEQLKRLWAWLWHGWVFWLGPLVAISCVPALLLAGATESAFRLIGLVLQFLGTVTVLIGLQQTRKLFSRPSLLGASLTWWDSRPSRSAHEPVSLKGQAAGVATTSGRLTFRQRPRPGATVEERVRVIESVIEALQDRTDALEAQFDRAGNERKLTIAEERNQRRAQFEDVSRKLEITEAGGLYLSFWGLIWLTLGLILSTASLELASLLAKIAT